MTNRADKNFVGEIFTNNNGDPFKVLGRTGEKDSNNNAYFEVKFLMTGSLATGLKGNILKGEIKDIMQPSLYGVGFTGQGIYGSRTHLHIFKVWANMLARCYDPNTQQNCPTYKDCKVAYVWHNFQNFAAWYEEHYPTDGQKYQLDKDKLGNSKIYSPDTCCFLTHSENTKLGSSNEIRRIA